MAEFTPYAKVIHLAKLIGENGEVSPACARRPRKIDLSREGWTLLSKVVTCEKCIAANKKAKAEGKLNA